MHANGWRWRSRWSWRATTTSFRPRPTSTIRRPGSRTRCSCRRPASSSASLTNLGLTDALRAVSDDAGLYTFWDYQAGAWQKNWGIRIDHVLLSPQAADRLSGAGIDSTCGAGRSLSDHVPVWVDLAIEMQ